MPAVHAAGVQEVLRGPHIVGIFQVCPVGRVSARQVAQVVGSTLSDQSLHSLFGDLISMSQNYHLCQEYENSHS